MKRSIEDIIKNNRASLDSEIPEEGHLERFYLKLENARPARTKTLQVLIRVAAVLVIGLISAAIMFTLVDQPLKNKPGTTLSEISPEMAETELYYQTEINTREQELKSLPFDGSGQKEKIINDMADMDESYAKLSEELKEHPYDERVISAMIEYYQLKLDVLNQVIHNLRQAAVLSRQKPVNRNKSIGQLL